MSLSIIVINISSEQALQKAVLELVQHQASLKQLRQKIKTVSQLDAQHTKALEHNKNLVAQLERDVADGRRRLRVKATCHDLSTNTTPSGVDDATAPRLADATQRDYFLLRNRIDIAGQQITGLQNYVRQVCLNKIQK
ncbi:lysis protein [Candidatus Hamiltonella defensa]|uniref:lysis protein n=1 Tax=Candidatus Williamhamiltonella defendens TaxID=138072 RepID=UPI0020C6ECDE|nr:lysis protein [Candidatus Hamiltonella defensa]